MRATPRPSVRPTLSLLALALSAALSPVQASSHREAPFITGAPKVDGTDFYLFNSYDPNSNGRLSATLRCEFLVRGQSAHEYLQEP